MHSHWCCFKTVSSVSSDRRDANRADGRSPSVSCEIRVEIRRRIDDAREKQ